MKRTRGTWPEGTRPKESARRRPASRAGARLAHAAAALVVAIAAACTGGEPDVVTPPAATAALPVTPATATPSPPVDRAPTPAPVAEPAAATGAENGEPAQVASERPLPGFRRVVLSRWAAITDQRRDVLDLGYRDVVRIVGGDARDWSEFGGSPQPITVYLPDMQAEAIAEALGLSAAASEAVLLAPGEIAERVASTPGAFALIEPERLRLGVLALTVGGHDPYRDAAWKSPVRLVRWVGEPGDSDAAALPAAGDVPAPFDPAGLLVTGELLPVRCSNYVVSVLDDYDLMFDGVRERIAASDIAVASLDSPTTSVGPPTPCVETFVLQGSARAVPAIAGAGFDVVLTNGNHMLDCWEECYGTDALRDTLARLEQAGIATAGAGTDLPAARAPAIVSVETAQGPVRFAFLGYDAIAWWYAATDSFPGTAPLSAAALREDVRAARLLADHVVVGASWGVEETSDPTASQLELGGVAVEAGASLVVGNHPHWVQAVEHIDGALVAYALGNFVFDQYDPVENTQGMLIELGFVAERLVGYRIRPVVIRAHDAVLRWPYRPELVDPAAEGRPVLDRVWEAQDRLSPR